MRMGGSLSSAHLLQNQRPALRRLVAERDGAAQAGLARVEARFSGGGQLGQHVAALHPVAHALEKQQAPGGIDHPPPSRAAGPPPPPRQAPPPAADPPPQAPPTRAPLPHPLRR